MFIQPPPDSPEAERVYQSTVPAQGFVMNLTRAWAWRPDVFEGFGALRTQLLSSASLTKRDQAVIICAMASQLQDAYCSLAWGKSLAAEAGPDEAAAILEGRITPSSTPRDRALAGWARKVASNPNGTTEADVASLRDAGFGDRDIVEITIFTAFRLAFSTVNDALGIAPDRRLADSAPAEVARAVHYGRAPG